MVDGKDLGSLTGRPRQADADVPSSIPGPIEAEDITFPEVAELNEIEPLETDVPWDEDDQEPRTGEPELPEEAYFLPPGFNETRIVLQVRDPEWVHAYWEVAECTWEQAAASRGGAWRPKSAPRMLRVYDVTGADAGGELSPEARSFDIRIDHGANNWYINVGQPARHYCVELGVVGPDGSFLPLCRSNRVMTPPGRPSDVIDLEWMTIEEGLLQAAHPAVGASPGMEKGWLARIGRERELASPGLGVSSPGIERAVAAGRPERPGLWLQADCDLIVYGKTDPAALATFNGRAIDVAPDGSFCVRVNLPEGCSCPATLRASLPERDPSEVEAGFEVTRRPRPGGKT